jgi:hypothetical protein
MTTRKIEYPEDIKIPIIIVMKRKMDVLSVIVINTTITGIVHRVEKDQRMEICQNIGGAAQTGRGEQGRLRKIEFTATSGDVGETVLHHLRH